jgi:hypothetical protein
MLQRKYFTALALICTLPLILFAQIDNAGIMDRHFHSVLFPEVYKELASTKINYPGLRDPERYGISAGLLPDLSGENWAAFYGWGEWANGPAIAGVWLGNTELGNGPGKDGMWYDLYVNESVFSIRSAVWVTPFSNHSFKGISVTYDALSKRHENELSGGIYDMDSTFFGFISLIQLSANLHLRAGISSQYYAGDSYYTVSMDREERITDGVFAGLIDKDNRTLELRVSNSYHYVDEFDSGVVNDTVNVSLLFSCGKVMPYHKHRFFYGLRGKGEISLLSNTGNSAGRFQYWRHIRNVKHKGRTIETGVSTPLIFDVSIFKTLHGVLSVNPQINYSHTDYSKKLKSQHTLNLTSPHPILSFYGTIGKNVEFAVKPSIENEVFFSAAEVRYRF